jgi:hypothetical protein
MSEPTEGFGNSQVDNEDRRVQLLIDVFRSLVWPMRNHRGRNLRYQSVPGYLPARCLSWRDDSEQIRTLARRRIDLHQMVSWSVYFLREH